jgi:SNF2 family DNA or RNA helicase
MPGLSGLDVARAASGRCHTVFTTAYDSHAIAAFEAGAVDYLMKINLVRRVLVICPLSIMKSAWQQDLFTFAMHRGCSVAHGASQQRRKIIGAGMEFVIINFDGVAVVQDELLAGGFDMIVVDECNAYKNVKTNRWKSFNYIA